MATLPNRLTRLVEAVENGETVTREELDKTARLMALDSAIYARELVEESLQRTREADVELGVPING